MASCEADVKPVPKDSWYGLESAEMRDLNGDGTAEAVISGGSSYCFGMTGLAFKLLTKSGSGWQVMTDSMGIPAFHPRKGIEWPDKIGRAHACTPVTNAHLELRRLMEKKNAI